MREEGARPQAEAAMMARAFDPSRLGGGGHRGHLHTCTPPASLAPTSTYATYFLGTYRRALWAILSSVAPNDACGILGPNWIVLHKSSCALGYSSSENSPFPQL
jgi:hypothetical protein